MRRFDVLFRVQEMRLAFAPQSAVGRAFLDLHADRMQRLGGWFALDQAQGCDLLQEMLDAGLRVRLTRENARPAAPEAS
jgi:hypothetical protein